MAIVNLNNEFSIMLDALRQAFDYIQTTNIELTERQQSNLSFAKTEYEKFLTGRQNLLEYDFSKLKKLVSTFLHPDLIDRKYEQFKPQFQEILGIFNGAIDKIMEESKRLKAQGQTEYHSSTSANSKDNRSNNNTSNHTDYSSSHTTNNNSYSTNTSYGNTEDYSRAWRPDYNPPPPKSSRTQQDSWNQEPVKSEYNGPVQILIGAIQRWVRIFITKKPSNYDEFEQIKKALERHLESVSSYIKTASIQKGNIELEISALRQACNHETSNYNVNIQYQNILTELYNQYMLDKDKRDVFGRQLHARKQTLEPMVRIALQQAQQEYSQTWAAYQRLLYELQNGFKFANNPYANTGLTCQQALDQMYAWITERQDLEKFVRNQIYSNDMEYKKIWSCYYSANMNFELSCQKYENYANNPAEKQAQIQMEISDKYEQKCEPLYKKYDKAVADLQTLNTEWSKLHSQYQTFLATYQDVFAPEEASMGRKYG